MMTPDGKEAPKSIAIVQPNYIPWKGYFDLVSAVDEFILYDDCQYTRRDWRNRNRFKTSTGTRYDRLERELDCEVEVVREQRLHRNDDLAPMGREHVRRARCSRFGKRTRIPVFTTRFIASFTRG